MEEINNLRRHTPVNRTSNSEVIRKVLLGEEHIITYPGISQYSRGSSSACGLASLNCVRLVFDLEQKGFKEDMLLQEMMQREMLEEILSICSSWSSDSHLELDEIHSIPLFQASLQLVTTDYGLPGIEKFQNMLHQLGHSGRFSNIRRSCAVVITRPPEIVVCLKIPHSGQDVYVLFDSHPRPRHPHGSAFIFSISLERTAQYLDELLQFDHRLLDANNGLQWQAQLLACVSGHYFESSKRNLSKPENAFQVLMDANLGMLAMKAEISQLKSQSSLLTSENKRLTEEIDTLERERESWKEERARYKGKAPERNSSSTSRLGYSPVHSRGLAQTAHWQKPIDGASFPRREKHRDEEQGRSEDQLKDSMRTIDASSYPGPTMRSLTPSSGAPLNDRSHGMFDEYAGSKGRAADNSKSTIDGLSYPTLRILTPGSDMLSNGGFEPSERENNSLYNPQGVQGEGSSSCAKEESDYTTSTADPSHSDILQEPQERSDGPHLVMTMDHTIKDPHFDPQLESHEESLMLNQAYALKLQQEFAEEDASLRSHFTLLAQTAQATFECGVCMDQLPVDFLARVEPCEHSFCRDCIRRHASIKIKDHRFPILCPSCSANNISKSPGTVNDLLILQLGLSQQEYDTFVELSMATFSILLHCRNCKRSAFVDRAEYQETSIIPCPLPNCNHLWCKSCQQAVEIGGPEHSCDGSSELDHLMGKRGWKYCPGCRTPTEKTDGCNHMTCMSPGCNTHFCYVCGHSIVQSALRSEIQSAVSTHYRKCLLFENAAN